MASLTVRGCVLCAASLLNMAFVFVSSADLVQFLSFRAIYHNITGETRLCDCKGPAAGRGSAGLFSGGVVSGTEFR